MKHHGLFGRCRVTDLDEVFARVDRGLIQITSQVQAIKDFVVELEKKIQISLALVSNPAVTCRPNLLLMELKAIQPYPTKQ